MTERYESARIMLQIYQRLCEGETITTNDIVEDFGVGRRRVSFFMDAIAEAGPNVTDGRRGKERCLRLREPMALVSVNRKLGIILALGRQFLTPFAGTDFADQYNNMMAEVEEAADDGSLNVMMRWRRKFIVRHPGQRRHAERDRELDAILKALEEERLLSFSYRSFAGRESRRQVEPLSLVFHREELYLVAREGDRRKMFALYSMTEIEVEAERFKYPEFKDYDPDGMFESSIGIWVSAEPPIDLVLRFDQRWETYFRRTRLHHSQQVTPNEDGTLDVRWRVALTVEVEQFILRFGPDATVISPPHVRQRIREIVSQMAANYGDKK